MEGIIIKGIGGFYYIKTDEGIIECKARGKFRYNSLKPMVGDRVTIKVENGKGVIEDIHERSSELIRPTVANVTQAFVVFAIKNPDINLDLLNRFLTLCEYNDIHAVVCLNKEDLCTDEEKENLKELINDEDKILLEKFEKNYHEKNIYFKLTKESIPFITRLSTREILFSTIYFTKYPCTIWGNYNKSFPIFYHDNNDIQQYLNIKNELQFF